MSRHGLVQLLILKIRLLDLVPTGLGFRPVIFTEPEGKLIGIALRPVEVNDRTKDI